MRAATIVLLTCLALSSQLHAQGGASDASVRELLEVMGSEQMLDATWTQMETLADSVEAQTASGRALNDEQKEIAAEMRERMFALYREELSWSSFEPQLVDVYARTFTQDEVDAMLAFYRTEVGQSSLKKMPLVMQESMMLVQPRMATLLPRLQELSREMGRRMREAASDKPAEGGE